MVVTETNAESQDLESTGETRRAPNAAFPLFPRVESKAMSDKRLLSTGIIGTVIAALCCFTPILVVLLGVVGLSAALGWLDYVLFPALAFFIGLTIYAIYRRRKRPTQVQALDSHP